VHRFQVILQLIYIYHISEPSDLHPALVESRKISSRNSIKSLVCFCLLSKLPAGFDTFNDVGRFTCVRPTFSVVVVVVVVVNIVDVDGLLFDESSFE
jgi:hypothetical protein